MFDFHSFMTRIIQDARRPHGGLLEGGGLFVRNRLMGGGLFQGGLIEEGLILRRVLYGIFIISGVVLNF